MILDPLVTDGFLLSTENRFFLVVNLSVKTSRNFLKLRCECLMRKEQSSLNLYKAYRMRELNISEENALKKQN